MGADPAPAPAGDALSTVMLLLKLMAFLKYVPLGPLVSSGQATCWWGAERGRSTASTLTREGFGRPSLCPQDRRQQGE